MKGSLSQVLQQSVRGHHALFDAEVVRAAMARARDGVPWVDASTARDTERVLDALEGEPDVRVQRALVARAPRSVQEVLCHLYFDALYRFMEAEAPVFH